MNAGRKPPYKRFMNEREGLEGRFNLCVDCKEEIKYTRCMYLRSKGCFRRVIQEPTKAPAIVV